MAEAFAAIDRAMEHAFGIHRRVSEELGGQRE